MANDKLMISGKVISILPEKKGVCKNGPWISQEYILMTEHPYPRKICFEIYGKKNIDKFNIKQGDKVEIGINIYSREFEGKWYTTVRAWCVNNLSKGRGYISEEENTPPHKGREKNKTPSKKTTQFDLDDLPF